MSFEGYFEKLCTKGHYCSFDVYDSDTEMCPHCASPFEYTHLVDETNGYEEDDPYSYQANREEIGFEDIWHIDHYGNKFATKRVLYKPAENSRWQKVTP